MPYPIKCLTNIAKYDPNFLTLIQCLTKIICNINKLINSRITFRKSRLVVRKQRVVINNASSDRGFIKAGMPQGSILGSLFFIIFINDIVIDIQSTIKLFADDTSLYLIIDNPQTTADILNRDLYKIHTWSTNWLVSFNPQKTETMIISRKINKPHQNWCHQQIM
jgi:hypothetical protein